MRIKVLNDQYMFRKVYKASQKTHLIKEYIL